ncbi:hypothetical protein F4861DRAFT_520016 [Xylaria intraflava]|nr:hypothetical protein F4861DRAFT_520016 [Xylaria intraflava]
MNISRIDGLRQGVVLSAQASPTTRSISRCQAVGAHKKCARFIADGLHSISYHSRQAKSQWAHNHHVSLWPAVAPVGGRRFLNYFTSYPPSGHSSNHSTAEPIETTGQPDKPPPSIQYAVVQRKEWCLKFVDYYDDTTVDEQFRVYTDPYSRGYASANGPNITVSDKPEDVELQTIDGERKFDEEAFEPTRRLQSVLSDWHRRRANVSLDTIWELYEAVPEPRLTYITARTRHLLMAALASVERKNEKSMLRYFKVVADTTNAGFSLTTTQWNTAMSFAARYVTVTTEVEVEAALNIWRMMEREAGLKGDSVTFNILFDAASKAGKFDLAEMVYTEMTRRGFAFNRYHHVSLIYFFGLKGDSSGVRAAYKELIEAGEIVDTVVFNSLIASFIRCGEEQSAEHVYEKMKETTSRLRTMPHRDYTMAQAITKTLMMFARVGKEHPSLLPTLRQSALPAPDLTTYRILLNHYGLRLGNLSKVAQFLDEMKRCRIPLSGAVFLSLFKSFAVHGGSGSDWSAQRLGSVWTAFLNAMDIGVEGLYISTWLAEAALEAHARYATRSELLDVYECLRSRWELDHSSSEYMLHILRKLLGRTGLRSSVPPWRR